MDLSIVILHTNRPKETMRTLEALVKADLPERTEVFVVNNGRKGENAKIPFDPEGKMGTPLPFELRYFEIPNGGYPQGNNFGLKKARGKYLCILTDVVVEKNTLKVLIDYLKKHKHVGVVAPRLVYPNGEVQDNYRTFPSFLDQIIKRTAARRFFSKRMRRYLMWDKDVMQSEPVDWLTGAMQVFTRACWDAIGPKDERYFLFMSDVDICRTAWEHKFGVHFVAEAQAQHDQSRLSGGGIRDLFKKWVVRVHVLDAIRYYLKWRGRGLPKGSPSGSLPS